MCLAVPGKVIEISEENGLKMGKIDYGGVQNTTCLEFVPEVNIGEYVIVHAGFALNVLDQKEAKITLDLIDELQQKKAEVERKLSE